MVVVVRDIPVEEVEVHHLLHIAEVVAVVQVGMHDDGHLELQNNLEPSLSSKRKRVYSMKGSNRNDDAMGFLFEGDSLSGCFGGPPSQPVFETDRSFTLSA